MKRINSIVAILLVLMLTSAIPVGAQEASPVVGTRDGIKALAPKEELAVKLKDGYSKKGKLNNVTDTMLILFEGKKTTELSRDSILQIYRSVPKSRRRAAGIGAAVAGGLVALGGITSDLDASFVVVQVVMWTGLGALIGRGIASGHERVLIYEARR